MSLASLSGMAPSDLPAAPTRDMWLLAGQSNAAGQGLAGDLASDLAAVQTAEIWNGTAFEPYDAPVNAQGSAGGMHGAEARFLKQAGAVDLIKSGEGGSALAFGSGEWNGTRNWHPETLDGLWERFVSKVNAARAARFRAGITPVVRGLIWIQGESDADAGRSAAAYQADLTDLIHSSRLEIDAELAWFIVMLNSASGALLGASHVAAIRSAQIMVASVVPTVTAIDTHGVALSADGVHYDGSGLDQIGRLVADQV